MRHVHRGGAVLATAFIALGALACGDDEEEPTGPVQEQFSVTLDGASERPDPVTTTATGTATLSFTGSGSITYSVTVSGLMSDPVGAHIHGPADVNTAAGIIVGLTPLANLVTGTLVSGTITGTDVPTISLDSLKVLLRNGNAYINVHTADNEAGEIRGQIIKQ
jgi:hypothetical protein